MFDGRWSEGRSYGRYYDGFDDEKCNRGYCCRERFGCNQCGGWNRRCGCQHISVRSCNRCQCNDFDRRCNRGNRYYVDGRRDYRDNHFEDDRDFCNNYNEY